MEPSAISTLIAELVPLADILTPNIPEAEKIAEMEIKTVEDTRQAARRIHAMGCHHVVIKGGHIKGDAADILFDGDNFYEFSAARIDTKHTHGTGCTFSSAIAANLARGFSVYTALERAKEYINTAIIHAPGLGKGNGPTHHFYDLYKTYFEEEKNV
jgi:hydroxymethylpyrimidine/phosphomethylpyrimidine kinase